MNRPKMLPNPAPHYNDYSEFPDYVRISFEGGKTAVYDLRMNMPHPLVKKNIEIINTTEQNIKQGYVNQPRRRRRRK